MTFTEAAVEVLRRTGQPTHYKEIATVAVTDNLLSHVGVMPEATMGARLLAMAQREGERRVVATAPGVFALAEWGVTPATQPTLDEPPPAPDDEPALRTRERHPPLQDELLVGGRREERRRRSDSDDEGKRRKRYGPPAELAHTWLRERGEAATLAEIAAALRANDRIAEALERDLASFEKALQEENRRRRDGRRPPMFEFLEDGRVLGLEQPKDQRPPKKEPQQQGKAKVEKRREELPKPMAADEQRRVVLRSLRRRLASLDVAALERVVVALLESQGYRELNMARRSAKEGPLYLCRHRFGAGELRYAVRVLGPGRDLGRAEVQEVRRDVAHFSAQIGAVFGNGECTRDARGEANTPGGSPVMLYGNEALAEALIDAGLGVSRHLIEWLDYDDEFFASIGAEAPFEDVPEQAVEGEAAVEATPSGQQPALREEGRGRRRRGRGRRGGEGGGGEAGPGPEGAGDEGVEAAEIEVVSSAQPADAEMETPAFDDSEPVDGTLVAQDANEQVSEEPVSEEPVSEEPVSGPSDEVPAASVSEAPEAAGDAVADSEPREEQAPVEG